METGDRYTSRQSFIRFIFHHKLGWRRKQKKFQFSKLFFTFFFAVHVVSSSPLYIRGCRVNDDILRADFDVERTVRALTVDGSEK